MRFGMEILTALDAYKERHGEPRGNYCRLWTAMIMKTVLEYRYAILHGLF